MLPAQRFIDCDRVRFYVDIAPVKCQRLTPAAACEQQQQREQSERLVRVLHDKPHFAVGDNSALSRLGPEMYSRVTARVEADWIVAGADGVSHDRRKDVDVVADCVLRVTARQAFSKLPHVARLNVLDVDAVEVFERGVFGGLIAVYRRRRQGRAVVLLPVGHELREQRARCLLKIIVRDFAENFTRLSCKVT